MEELFANFFTIGWKCKTIKVVVFKENIVYCIRPLKNETIIPEEIFCKVRIAIAG